jgi:Skp family chaperone for outer membrane proteins
MTINKRLMAAMLAAPAALAFTAPAHAQVTGGIATANPLGVITASKAFEAAEKSIEAEFKPSYDQIAARQARFQAEIKPLLTTIDTNKDGEVSEQEDAAATARKDPNYQKILAAQNTANQEIQRLQLPSVISELYALEKILDIYDASQQRVVAARKIGVILNPSAIIWGPEALDISQAILAEVDKTPTVTTKAPANWQPQQRTLELQKQVNELRRRAYQLAVLRAQQQQQQGTQGAAPAGARPAGAPAAGAPARPAAGTPAKPAEPR